ncbi:hypothetical protein [Streptomyces thermolilacinus]|uniref:Uncharacterized protein n=1 Tax=Streptomyces thermolilacinus SPC6 TaxID=1306406 RepID=A0A1D3DLA5_9ACTN|nr:hypothetical protein [Streptomyces thermolilacinus]OEJ93118.1 hypothetical protein J116_027985 [Streptomyces thermolilacinus SPC6]
MTQPQPQRCAVAHSTDTSPCEGPADAVRVRDRTGRERLGCVEHAARALASIEGATVSNGPSGYDQYLSLSGPQSAAHDAWRRAHHMHPYQWQTTEETAAR